MSAEGKKQETRFVIDEKKEGWLIYCTRDDIVWEKMEPMHLEYTMCVVFVAGTGVGRAGTWTDRLWESL